MTPPATSVRLLAPGDEEPLWRFLEGRPDTTMFLRSNLRQAGLADTGRPYEGTWAAALRDGEVVGAAACFWNGNVILEAPEAVEEVVRIAARAARREVAGLIGPAAQVDRARRAFRLANAPTRMDSREILFALDLDALRVPAALAEGRVACRRAVPGDRDLLVEWRLAYVLETQAGTDAAGMRDACAASVERLLDEGIVWVLEAARRPVAMTAFNATLPDCVQVGGVFTPPALRGRGHARAAVAGSLLDARAGGARRSILFTGEDNAPALACYRGLGYEPVGDYGICLLRDAVRLD